MNGFAPVGQVLKRLARSAPWGEGLQRHEVLRHWEEAVGPTVARMAHPVEVKSRTLYVDVRDPVWLQQLVFLSDSVRRALNESVGRDALERVFFRLSDGPVRGAFPDAETGAAEAKERRSRLAAQAPDRGAVGSLSAISDPAVREAVASLLQRAGESSP